MTSTLALLGFLALIALLAHRIVIACERHNHTRNHRQRVFAGRKMRQKQPKISPEESEPMVALRQV